MWLEGALGFGFPIVMMPLLWLVQGHRYDIIESIGCTIPTFFAWPGIILRYFVPLILSLASMIYSGELFSLRCFRSGTFFDRIAVLAIRWFVIRRLQFRSILAASNSGLNISRYLRLIALAVVLNVILLSNDLILIVFTLSTRIESSESLSAVHTGFDVISYFPESLYNQTYLAIQVLQIYIGPFYALVFFIFFGLSEEAISDYVGLMGKGQHLVTRIFASKSM